MKPIYQITLLLSSLIILCSNSCRKGGKCETAPDVRLSSSIQVTFKDAATGKYLYEEAFPLYNKDSLKVYDENGNSLLVGSQKNRDPLTNIGYFEMAFLPLYNSQTDQSAFNAELCRNFIVKYKYNETDTIRACFKARITECGSLFSTLKGFHKGILIGTFTETSDLLVTVIKN